MWQFGEAVRGIGDACRAFEVPITGGNVSLYNETEGRAIYPTPVLGVVGLIEDASRTCTRTFKGPGAMVMLLGENHGELGGSEYLARLHGIVRGMPPALDLGRERALQRLVIQLIREGVLQSAHDCAEGGLAVAVAECAFDSGGIGVTMDVPAAGPTGEFQAVATLFGESASRIVVSALPERLDAVVDAAKAAGVPCRVIGATGGDHIRLAVDGSEVVQTPVAAAETAWATVIERTMARRGDARR
jgi:phosphoribosylformylglycinamidine synthase